MLDTTIIAIKAIMAADPSLTPDSRRAILSAITNGHNDQPTDRLLKRKEVSKMFSCTPRTIDNLQKTGVLTPIKLPGRTRSLGFKLSEVEALIKSVK